MESIIHIKATQDIDDKILSELMTILINHGFKTEKYLGITSKIVMARKEMNNENTTSTFNLSWKNW